MSTRVVSLFSGCGGMDLGAIQAGAEVIWANDIAWLYVEPCDSQFCGLWRGAIAEAATALVKSEKYVQISGYKSPPFRDIYRRLAFDRPSPTITGGSNNGGGKSGFHPTENRRLTVREIARLFGFPDSFLFLGSYTAQRQQLANAVPPPGIKPIIASLIKQDFSLMPGVAA